MTDKDVLGRAFARDPNWRWLPGMGYRIGDAHFRLDSRTLWAAAERRDAVPDLDDHATIGCIEHGLLPDLIGMPNASLWWSQGKWHYGCGATSWGQGRSKPEALLSALRSVRRGVALRG